MGAVVFDVKASRPTAVLALAVVFASNAPLPTAVLFVPVVFNNKELYPTAVLAVPVVLAFKACCPIAVVASTKCAAKAYAPIAVFSTPVRLAPYASVPNAELVPPFVILSPAP